MNTWEFHSISLFKVLSVHFALSAFIPQVIQQAPAECLCTRTEQRPEDRALHDKHTDQGSLRLQESSSVSPPKLDKSKCIQFLEGTNGALVERLCPV